MTGDHLTGHIVLDLSHKSRLFAVGDIHGEYDLLEEELIQVNFDTNQDALILVGDLADRGPKSPDSIDWIKRPYVYRTLGNHDIMPGLYLNNQETKRTIDSWGGGWFTNLPDSEIKQIAEAFEDAPVCMTVITPNKFKVGVAHADCLSDWDEQIEALSVTSKRKTWVRDLTLWGRNTISTLMNLQKEGLPLDPSIAHVKNVDHVFHGHTILGAPFTLSNRSWIDTGAYMGGCLTLIDIDKFLQERKPRS